jgi:hypothetical protein
VKAAATLCAASLLALVGFGLAGCNDGPDTSITNSPGVNQKPSQPTTGSVGSESPTPPADTTNTATGTTG